LVKEALPDRRGEISYRRLHVWSHHLFDPADPGVFQQFARIELFLFLVEFQCLQHYVHSNLIAKFEAVGQRFLGVVYFDGYSINHTQTGSGLAFCHYACYLFFMARPIRIEYEGGFYHVTSRGNARQDIFTDTKDYRTFLTILADVVEQYRWIVHAYCLMGNHYHLLVETPRANLSRGMRHLNGVYTQKYNRNHNSVGHLFQGRYKAFVVEKDAYLLELGRYIVLNPVLAGLVHSPEEWSWSSYGATTGMRPQESFLHTDWLLGLFSPSKSHARERYASFVKEGSGIGSPLKEARGGLIVGRGEFIEKIQKIIDASEPSEAVRMEKYAARPSLAEIFDGTERNEGIHDAVCRWGYTLKDVGNHIGLHYSRVSRIASRVRMAKSKT